MSSTTPPPPPEEPTSGADQPAAPPPAAPPPPSAPPSYGGGGAAAPPRDVWDYIVVVAPVLALIVSFMPFYTVSASVRIEGAGGGMGGGAISEDGNAWHGVFGWLGVLLGLAAALLMLLRLANVATSGSVLNAVLGLTAAAVACVVIALFVVPVGDVDAARTQIEGLGGTLEVDEGHAWGYWVVLALLVVTLVGAVLKLNRSRQS